MHSEQIARENAISQIIGEAEQSASSFSTRMDQLSAEERRLREQLEHLIQERHEALVSTHQATEAQMRNDITESAARLTSQLEQQSAEHHKLREHGERTSKEQNDALIAELRREQGVREAANAQMTFDIEEEKQSALRFTTQMERQIAELKNAIADESRARGRNMEAMLSELAGGQVDIRKALDTLRSEMMQITEDREQLAKGLLREASARENFEQSFKEKVRSIGDAADDLGRRLATAIESMRKEVDDRQAADFELQSLFREFQRGRGPLLGSGSHLPPADLDATVPILEQNNRADSARQARQASLVPVSVSTTGPTVQPINFAGQAGPQRMQPGQTGQQQQQQLNRMPAAQPSPQGFMQPRGVAGKGPVYPGPSANWGPISRS